MLNSLRAGAKTWIAKILLLLLVASFAVWGISGQITGGVGQNTVLTAGDSTVSVNEYRLAYDRQFRVFQSQLGRGVSREQARLFGIESQVLSQLVAGLVLDEQARQMELGLSEDRLAALIAEDTAFHGLNGQFDRQQFQLVLRDVGMREEDYIKTREAVAIRTQIVEAAVDGMAVPNVFLNAAVAHQGEKRDVTFLTIDESALPAIAAPDAVTLDSWFEDNLASYRAPEYRQVRYVRLTAEDIADPATVAESTVRSEYEATIDRYTTPERRTIEQLVFADRDAADAAHERLLAGESFEAIVDSEGKTLADITTRDMARSDIPDEAIAEAAFSLETAGDISVVVDGLFGPVIIRAAAITPEAMQPFETVSQSIREELALVEANDILLNVHDAYEDARAGGQSLEEAARGQDLTVVTIDAVDRQGNGPDDAPLANLPAAEDFLAQVFESEVLVENPPLNAGRSGFLWYEVVDVTPDRDRRLDEVRARASQDWIAEQGANQLETEAGRIAELLTSGRTPQDVAEETGYPVNTTFGLERTSNDADFGVDGVAAIFDEGPQAIGSVASPTGNAQLVFRVDTISAPLADASALAADNREQLSRQLAGDLLDQVVGRAQVEIPVTVNQAAIQRALAEM